MIAHTLDTDTLTLFQRGHPVVSARCNAAPADTLSTTMLSVEEQFLGWYTRARQAKRDDEIVRAYTGMAEFASFLRRLSVLPYSTGALARFRQFKASKIKVGSKDLSIAAIALDHGVTLVTCNVSDFNQVPGLLVEDWSK